MYVIGNLEIGNMTEAGTGNQGIEKVIEDVSLQRCVS